MTRSVSLRDDEPTVRVRTVRKPAPAAHVDVIAPNRISHIARVRSSDPPVLGELPCPSLCPIDEALERMSAPAMRARSACDSTRTAAICLGAAARDAGNASRKRAASTFESGTRVKTIPGMQALAMQVLRENEDSE